MSFDNSRFTFNPRNDYSGLSCSRAASSWTPTGTSGSPSSTRRIQAGTLDTPRPRGLSGDHAVSPSRSRRRAPAGRTRSRSAPDACTSTACWRRTTARQTTAQWDPALAEMSSTPQPPPDPRTAVDFTKQPYMPHGTTLPAGNGPFLAISMSGSDRSLSQRSRPDRQGRRRRFHRPSADGVAGQVLAFAAVRDAGFGDRQPARHRPDCSRPERRVPVRPVLPHRGAGYTGSRTSSTASRSTRREPRPTTRRRRATMMLELDDGSSVEADELRAAAGRGARDLGHEPAWPSWGSSTTPLAVVAVAVAVAGDDLRLPGSRTGCSTMGDVNGRVLLTHMGKYQGRLVADAIFGREVRLRSDGARSPQVIFTDPQVGAVGLHARRGAGGGSQRAPRRRRDRSQPRRLVRRARRARDVAARHRRGQAGRRRLHDHRARGRRGASRCHDRR